MIIVGNKCIIRLVVPVADDADSTWNRIFYEVELFAVCKFRCLLILDMRRI